MNENPHLSDAAKERLKYIEDASSNKSSSDEEEDEEESAVIR